MACLIKDPALIPIWEKVQANVRLSREDGIALFSSEDFFGLGFMANAVKERRTGNRVTYVVNRHINPTNICALSCRFCDYATKKDKPDATVLSPDDILSQLSDDLTEVHIVSALYTGWTYEQYLDVIRVIKTRFPRVQVKAYTAVEIDFFTRLAKKTLKEVLQDLMAAGVVCLPGGGAEVFSERVRKSLFPFKIGASKWLEVHRAAHGLGLKSNATLLYGHMETKEERVDHMLKLRDLQDETHGFMSFIPLAYQPGKTRVVPRPASVIEDLKTVAVSRLLLDNFDHIKAYWVTLGEETASLALHFGADDIDGTIGDEKIAHAAGAASPVRMAREALIQLIKEAGRVPVERDALYRPLRMIDQTVEMPEMVGAEVS
ncbi:MAG: aminofutalosine synthase MqnE [Elusimicrobia bacterium]|nr:aminofutalosine synthase MqnE [Candidatus Obscuribacterium magneticum]